MAGPQVPIEFLASFGKAISGLQDFAGQVNTSVGKMESRFSTLTNAVGAIAGVFAVSKIIGGLRDMADEAAHSEAVVNRMSNALRTSGDYSERNVRAFRDLADELARTSKFDDDLILDQVRLAKQFNLTNVEAEKLIRAAVDLSAATGDDLSVSVRNLGQTFDGTVGRVGQMIPQLQNLTAEQLRAGEAVNIVAKRFGGFAERELQTFEGATAQLSKAFNDLNKSIGKSFVENKTVVTLFQEVTQIFYDLTEVIRENGDEIRNFISNSILVLVDSFGVLVVATDQVYRFFEILVAQVRALGTALVGFAEIASGQVTDGFNTMKRAAREYSAEMVEIGKRSKVFEDLAARTAQISVKLENVAKSQRAVVKSTSEVARGFDNQTGAVRRFNAEVRSKFENLKKELKDVGESQLEVLRRNYQENLKLVESAKREGFQKDVEREGILGKLRLKYIQDAIKVVQQNPFSGIFGPTTAGGAAGLSNGSAIGLARGLSAGQQVFGGAEGARNLIGLAAGEAGKALFGPAGEALGPIVKELSKGPDAVKKMVTEFADAVPVLVENVVKSIPVVIEVLADKLPEIVEKLVDSAPEIIEALVRAAPRIIAKLATVAPKIAFEMVKGAVRAGAELIKGAGGFISKLLRGALQFVGKILEGAGQFIKKLLDKLNPFKGGGGGGFGLGGNKGLLGGNIIKGLLKSGGDSGLSDTAATPLLKTQVSSKGGGGPSQIAVSVQISKREIANTILDIKKLGYRLEPA